MMDTQKLLRDAPKGEVTMKDDRMQVVFRRRYTKPVAKVWAALTTPERLEDWFGAAKIDLRVGGTLHITSANGKSSEFSITRVDAPHVLGWSWMIDGKASVIPEGQPSAPLQPLCGSATYTGSARLTATGSRSRPPTSWI